MGASRAKVQSRPVAIYGRALAYHNEEDFPRVPTADPTYTPSVDVRSDDYRFP